MCINRPNPKFTRLTQVNPVASAVNKLYKHSQCQQISTGDPKKMTPC
jgi:hypothetical protein